MASASSLTSPALRVSALLGSFLAISARNLFARQSLRAAVTRGERETPESKQQISCTVQASAGSFSAEAKKEPHTSVSSGTGRWPSAQAISETSAGVASTHGQVEHKLQSKDCGQGSPFGSCAQTRASDQRVEQRVSLSRIVQSSTPSARTQIRISAASLERTLASAQSRSALSLELKKHSCLRNASSASLCRGSLPAAPASAKDWANRLRSCAGNSGSLHCDTAAAAVFTKRLRIQASVCVPASSNSTRSLFENSATRATTCSFNTSVRSLVAVLVFANARASSDKSCGLKSRRRKRASCAMSTRQGPKTASRSGSMWGHAAAIAPAVIVASLADAMWI
mmetsp:Transcript_101076/g.193699  ORF Transcript_101076/g.193699 Transcript_101076/m.193699 type:complete len:340 (+) Transcript_101076:1080-2099(+)